MTGVKGVDKGRPSETIRQDRSASHANGAGEVFVARGEVALEGSHRGVDAFGGRPYFLSKLGQSITAEVALHQLPAEALLKLCNATLHR